MFLAVKMKGQNLMRTSIRSSLLHYILDFFNNRESWDFKTIFLLVDSSSWQ